MLSHMVVVSLLASLLFQYFYQQLDQDALMQCCRGSGVYAYNYSMLVVQGGPAFRNAASTPSSSEQAQPDALEH